MSSDVGRLREELYEWCGNDNVCRRAADYYVALVKNPCYPPATRRTKYYEKIVEKYGPPPPCDVKKLVLERLRNTKLEAYIDEIAELAALARRKLHIKSRVAAATATIVVAEHHGYVVIRNNAAKRFGTSYNSVKTWLRQVYQLYIELLASKKV